MAYVAPGADSLRTRGTSPKTGHGGLSRQLLHGHPSALRSLALHADRTIQVELCSGLTLPQIVIARRG